MCNTLFRWTALVEHLVPWRQDKVKRVSDWVVDYETSLFVLFLYVHRNEAAQHLLRQSIPGECQGRGEWRWQWPFSRLRGTLIRSCFEMYHLNYNSETVECGEDRIKHTNRWQSVGVARVYHRTYVFSGGGRWSHHHHVGGSSNWWRRARSWVEGCIWIIGYLYILALRTQSFSNEKEYTHDHIHSQAQKFHIYYSW